jgi:hypothetical protein
MYNWGKQASRSRFGCGGDDDDDDEHTLLLGMMMVLLTCGEM